MKKYFFLGIALLLAGALVVYFNLRQRRAKNLLIISVDALRADHLSDYGYPLKQKNLGEFASHSLVFDNAFTAIPTTEPALSSVFTSMHPRSHTVRKNGIQLPDEAVTLAEVLKNAGWKTAAFVSAFPLDRRFNLDQGFDEYRDSIGAKGKKKNLKFEVRGDVMTQAVLKWLNKNPIDSKQFLWIHYFDPHAPYHPPKQFASIKSPVPGATTEMNLYDGEIQFLDEQLGILFKALEEKNLLQDTLIVFLGDHGEGFNEHGYSGHGWFLYDEVIRIPLIIRGPGIRPGRTPSLTEQIDLAPGILDYFGIPQPATFQGRSWWQVLRGLAPVRDAVWVERRLPPIPAGPEPEYESHPGVEEKWACRTATGKFIWSSDGNHEYYDLATDPMERRNLYTPENQDAAAVEKMGKEIRDRALKLSLAPGRDMQQQDEDVREGLKALGYIN